MLEKLSFKVCFLCSCLRGLYITFGRLAVVFWITNKREREGESEKMKAKILHRWGKVGRAFLIY